MSRNLSHLILTPDEMACVDEAAASSGIPIYDLMVRAGYAVAATALARYPQAKRFIVLCGPGNNGGDGYVAASALRDAGANVTVFALGDPQRLEGVAAKARDTWRGEVKAIENYEPAPGEVVIDAVFGAGLTRTVPDVIVTFIRKVRDKDLPVLAVDLPSGLCGRRGVPLGGAFEADCTVTFMTRKPGHLLLPGRSLCGDIEIVDIGIPWRIIEAQAGGPTENGPHLWRHLLPSAGADSHKYRRGHLAVFSGEASKTGSARLSAKAGLKSGAGLVTIASATEAMEINAGHLTAVMLKQLDTVDDLTDWLQDRRLQTFVLGPGFGTGENAKDFALALRDRFLVLDADGITSFKDEPNLLFDAFSTGAPHLVLTPHEGEFARLFPDLAADDSLGKVEKTRAAAKRSHAAVVYKGADTVIAAPDGRATINANGPPWLATAGSGDVLAGMTGALLAQGMPAFEAAAAAVYLHGEAAQLAGPGMTAEDLAEHAGKALARIAGDL